MLERIVALCTVACCAGPVSAQWTLSSHLATDGSSAGSPVVAGASLASVNGHAGLRLGFSTDVGRTPLANLATPSQRLAPAQFTGDVDLMLFPFRTPRRYGLAPYALGGIGVRAAETRDQPEILGASYGGGVQVHLAKHFGLFVESRRRVPMNASAIEHAQLENGWEFRAGISIRLGSARRPATAARRPAAPASAPAPFPMATTRTESRPGAETTKSPAPSSARSARLAIAERTIDSGEAYLGVRYQWGGTLPSSGFDCSGFVQYVYRMHGVTLPRVSRQQAHAGLPVALVGSGRGTSAFIGALEPGDLMFFASNGTRIDHVAIYAGNARILHSSKSGGGVAYDDLRTSRGAWFRQHFVSARRVIPGRNL